MSHVVSLDMDLAFRGKQVEWRQLQVADRSHWPTVVTIGIDIAIRSSQAMPIEFEQRQSVRAPGFPRLTKYNNGVINYEE